MVITINYSVVHLSVLITMATILPKSNDTYFINFPNHGEISKSCGETYNPVFQTQKYELEDIMYHIHKHALHYIQAKLGNKEEKEISNGSGGPATSISTLQTVLLQWIYSLVGYKPLSSENLEDVLRINTLKFFQDTSLAVVPLFLITLVDMISSVRLKSLF
jgi:hypothetical protein